MHVSGITEVVSKPFPKSHIYSVIGHYTFIAKVLHVI